MDFDRTNEVNKSTQAKVIIWMMKVSNWELIVGWRTIGDSWK